MRVWKLGHWWLLTEQFLREIAWCAEARSEYRGVSKKKKSLAALWLVEFTYVISRFPSSSELAIGTRTAIGNVFAGNLMELLGHSKAAELNIGFLDDYLFVNAAAWIENFLCDEFRRHVVTPIVLMAVNLYLINYWELEYYNRNISCFRLKYRKSNSAIYFGLLKPHRKRKGQE